MMAEQERDGFTDDEMVKAVRDANPQNEDSPVTLPDGTVVPFSRIIALTNGEALEWLPVMKEKVE